MNYVDNKEWIVIVASLWLLLNWFLRNWDIYRSENKLKNFLTQKQKTTDDHLSEIASALSNVSFTVNGLYKESELIGHLKKTDRRLEELEKDRKPKKNVS